MRGITYSDDDVEPQFVNIPHVGIGGGPVGDKLHQRVCLLQHELQNQAERKHVHLAGQREVLRLVLEDVGVATLKEGAAHLGGHVLGCPSLVVLLLGTDLGRTEVRYLDLQVVSDANVLGCRKKKKKINQSKVLLHDYNG